MKGRPTESTWLAQGHPVSGWQSLDVNPSLLVSLLVLHQYIRLSPDSHFSSDSLCKQGRQCSDRSCLRAILIALLFCWRNTDVVTRSPWSLQPSYCSGSHQMLLFPRYLNIAKPLRTHKQDCLDDESPWHPFTATLILCWYRQSTCLGQSPKVNGWLVIPNIRTPHSHEAHSKPNSRPGICDDQVWNYKVGKVNSGEKKEELTFTAFPLMHLVSN